MLILSIAQFFCGLLLLLIGGLILSRRPSKANSAFFLLTLSTSAWLISYSFLISAKDGENALIFAKIGYLGVLFIPPNLYHFITCFLGLNKRRKCIFSFIVAFLFSLILLFTDFFIKGIHRYTWGYYPISSFIQPFYLFYYFLLWGLCLEYCWKKFQEFKKTTDNNRANQIKYLFFAFFIASAGAVDFLPNYNIDILPFGFLTVFLNICIIAYAISKYRLMDITVAITRTTIFIFVYSLVLGIPFAMAFGLRDYLSALIGSEWWIVPLITSTVLGTAGPFIYFFIQRKAEDSLLRDQKRYQTTLKQASAGMTRIKDLKKLLNMIVYILARTVNITHAALYLYNPKSRDYTLEAIRGDKLSEKNYYINRKSALIDYLEKAKLPIVAEEIKQQSQDYSREDLGEVYLQLRDLSAEVVVPILTEKRLLAIGILGKKKTGAMYAPDDLTVFSILASQVALAIENAQFYEESKQTQEQLFQAEKMATIGTMADGLSHQINNRLHTLGFIAGDALDTIKLSKEVQNPDKFKEILEEISKALIKIQDNVRQGGEIVQGLLRYTRKGQEGFGDVVFDKLIDEVVEMAQFKIKKEYMSIVKDYPQDLPAIRGNFTQLQEVFFNIIDNAYDAIMQKRSELGDDHFVGKVKISTRQTEKFLEISLLDNGMGVKDEDQLKLFTPFFTTKFSNKKGTGLGLYVIKKIIEENHQGEVLISSEDKVGTLFVVRLPIGKKE